MAGSTWGDSLTTAHGFPDLGSEVRGKLPRKALVPALSPVPLPAKPRLQESRVSWDPREKQKSLDGLFIPATR